MLLTEKRRYYPGRRKSGEKKREKKGEACASLVLRGGDGDAEEASLEGRLVLQ